MYLKFLLLYINIAKEKMLIIIIFPCLDSIGKEIARKINKKENHRDGLEDI